jgi:hypothetical protein
LSYPRNRADGISEIEGKAARAAASELGSERVSTPWFCLKESAEICVICGSFPKFFKKGFDAIARFAVKGCAPSDVCTPDQATDRFQKFPKIYERKT